MSYHGMVITIHVYTYGSLVMRWLLTCGKVWKTPDSRNACSACAGDYEDPDRTSWLEIDEEVDEDDEQPDSDEQ